MKNYSLLIALLIFSACEKKPESEGEKETSKILVAAVNYPLAYFAETIGGDAVEVLFPTPAGIDPAYWNPDPEQVSLYQDADIILQNGAGYAKWTEKVSLPASKLTNTSQNFEDQWIVTDAGVTHSHGPEGEHAHKETAFTTWLNFKFAAKQAEAVYETLKAKLPDQQEQLDTNYGQLSEKISALDAAMKQLGAKAGDQHMLASHPVYQYMEAGYSIHLISLHWEPGEMPAEEAWTNLENTVNEEGIKLMLWEGQPLPEIRSRLEGLGVSVVVFSPGGNRPVSGDFMLMMNTNIQELEGALGVE